MKITDRFILAGCAGLSLLTMGLTWQSPVGRSLMQEQPIRGLLIGRDYKGNTRHSDTMMVVSYDPRTRFLDVLHSTRYDGIRSGDARRETDQ